MIKISWQHYLKNQVVLSTDQIRYEHTNAKQAFLSEKLVANLLIMLEVTILKLFTGKEEALTEQKL